MRKLILRRKSSPIASLIKVTVYARDEAGDVLIDRLPCRKLGTIKNGELETFSIPEERTAIFVLASEPNDHTVYPFQSIDAGSEDVLLSVKMKQRKDQTNEKFTVSFDPNSRFDPKKVESRINTKKWFRHILLLLCIIGACRGCDAYMDEPRTFIKGEFSITLTNSFEEEEYEGSVALYDSGEAAIFVDKIEPQDPDQTAEQYVENWMLSDKTYYLTKKNDNGSVSFEYDKTTDGSDSLHYTFFVHRTSDAIWVVQFISKTEDTTDELKDKIKTWAQSVSFSTK